MPPLLKRNLRPFTRQHQKRQRDVHVVNAIILWNTIYMAPALAQLRAEGFDVGDEDVARLSPLSHEHINMLSRHAFTLPRTYRPW